MRCGFRAGGIQRRRGSARWANVCTMNRIRSLLSLIIASLVAGCASRPDSVALTPLPSRSPVVPEFGVTNLIHFSEALMYRDVVLSLRYPRNAQFQMRLVSIGDDATTIIRLDSGKELSAKPGEYFSCSQFGRSGLQLVSASHKTGAAVFRRTICESR